MKSKIQNIITAAAILLLAAPALSAQHTRTGYFLEDYTYRFQMNPAMDNSKGFVAMPALGNLNVGVNGTLGISDVIYNVNGKTTTFMNPGVSASEFLSHIKDENKFGLTFNTPILAVGVKGLGGYNTVTLSVVTNADMKLPGSIFSLLKEGLANKTYDIGNIDAEATAYAQIAFGHSRQVTDELRAGATLKVLIGAGRVSLDMEHADLELGTDAWRITTEGQINANINGLKYKTDINNTTGSRYVSGVDVDNAKTAGYGVGLDLGAVYAPKALPDFKFSASILDLGMIVWNNNMVASTQGKKTFTTDAYTFNVDGDAPNSFSKEWDKLKDELSSLYQLSDLGDQGSQTTMLKATLNVGAEYTLPMYKAAKVGLLSTTRFAGQYTWTDFRLSANWAPCRIFDASVSVGAGTFGADFGWLANLHLTGLNLFVGMDNFASKLSTLGVPVHSNNSVNFGLNFLF